jgi:hypothetical protein
VSLARFSSGKGRGWYGIWHRSRVGRLSAVSGILSGGEHVFCEEDHGSNGDGDDGAVVGMAVRKAGRRNQVAR